MRVSLAAIITSKSHYNTIKMHTSLSSTLIFLLGISQVPLTSGFRVVFYLGSQCRGARWGSGSYRFSSTSDTCHDVPTNAVSATIEREDGYDSDTYSTINPFPTPSKKARLTHFAPSDIAFWKDGCSRGLRASGDGGGCINFAGAQWFSVRGDWNLPGKMKTREAEPEPEPEPEVVPVVPAPRVNKRRIQPRAWEVHQATYRQKLGLTEETALGSLSPYFDPDLMGQGGVGHGNVSDSYGVTVRWHQVALGITVGIPIDEWDDAIHVKSDRFIPYGNEYSATGTGGGADCDAGGICASHWSLAERDEHTKRWNYAQCRSLLTCARDLGPAIDLRLRDGWG